MSMSKDDRSYALPNKRGKQMDEQLASLIGSVRFTMDE